MPALPDGAMNAHDIPQLRGMYNGDRSRKEVLVEYGFRLPSALDTARSSSRVREADGHHAHTSATPDL